MIPTGRSTRIWPRKRWRAEKILDWLTKDPQLVYDRVKAIENSFCLGDGEQLAVADYADMPTRQAAGRPEPLDRRFPKHLQQFMHEWATSTAPLAVRRARTRSRAAAASSARHRATSADEASPTSKRLRATVN